MEALTRLVTESLVRHGFDRPLDYRRLHWSRWFRCESVHSLLFVPSKPGVFALAEEISPTHVAADAACPESSRKVRPPENITNREGHDVSRAEEAYPDPAALAPEGQPRRMLAVTQFFEDDDMAFVLDRMLSRDNPLRARLLSGRYFVRFVVIEDPTQRRSICAALNQWMANSAEKATGIGPHFATSLELTPATEHEASVARVPSPASVESVAAHGATGASPVPRSEASGPGTSQGFSDPTTIPTAPHLDSGAASNIHCPSPLPSGF
jgi:hypothetical protein